jgi:hypothetical protein
MLHLNIHVQHAGFIIDYKENEDMDLWIASAQTVPGRSGFHILIRAWNSFNNAKEKGIDFFTNQLNLKPKTGFYKTLIYTYPGNTGSRREYYFKCPGLAISTVCWIQSAYTLRTFQGFLIQMKKRDPDAFWKSNSTNLHSF